MSTIKIQVLLLMFIWIPAIICATTPQNFSVAKPNCVDKCGDILIPYPFGTTEDCYRNSTFWVTCNHTFTPPQLYMWNSSLRITEISLTGQLKVMQRIAKTCYSPDGTLIVNNMTHFRVPYLLTVNNTANKFTVVGCDSYAQIYGWRRRDRYYNTGCVTRCRGLEDIDDGLCTGMGCCQTSGIPQDIWSMNVTAISFRNHTNVTSFNNCTYAFIVEDKAFKFSTDNLTNLWNVQRLPAVLGWVFANETCELGKKNSSSYGCISNYSRCSEPIGGEGYTCQCNPGYDGNPYLSDGCRDVNECASNHDRNCIFKCNNLNGTYTCGCPKGYMGDGEGERGCYCPSGYHDDGSGTIREGGCIRSDSRIYKPIAGLILVSTLIALLSMIFAFSKFVKKKMKQQRRKKFFKLNGGLLLKQETSSNKGILRRTRLFTAKELEKATDHFNETRILGRGGQGTVYKGMLSDGQIVAIKKSKLVDENKSKHLVEQFINEVVILSLISHRNVVKLLGCCLETRIPLLVYEFMPNGTLSDLIQGKNIEFPFTWAMRLKTAADVAGALAYLHSATSVPIFHRDVKSSNILLDEKFISKVSDFGTSKSIEVDQTHLTTVVQGTFGYIDPEYFQSSQFTEKSDVYSFGVGLVELLTGLKAIMASTSTEDNNKSLVTRFLSTMRDNNLELILEGQVSGEEEKKEVVAVAELAKRCLHLNGKKRPYMTEVAMELEAVRKSGMKSNNTTELPGDFNITNSAFSVEDSEYGWTHTSEFDTMSSSDVHPIMLNTI